MDVLGLVTFAREIEPMKSQPRTAWTATGRRESVAEHSWRLAMLAMAFCGQRPGLDGQRVLEMCLVHDLGELYDGDVSAALGPDAGKADRERAALRRATRHLPQGVAQHMADLWQEYDRGLTPEAKLVKALDKAETIIQHNQGRNPPEFGYAFNLEYGASWFQDDPDLMALRNLLDRDTRSRMAGEGRAQDSGPT